MLVSYSSKESQDHVYQEDKVDDVKSNVPGLSFGVIKVKLWNKGNSPGNHCAGDQQEHNDDDIPDNLSLRILDNNALGAANHLHMLTHELHVGYLLRFSAGFGVLRLEGGAPQQVEVVFPIHTQVRALPAT
jgi:hypothetical protein